MEGALPTKPPLQGQVPFLARWEVGANLQLFSSQHKYFENMSSNQACKKHTSYFGFSIKFWA